MQVPDWNRNLAPFIKTLRRENGSVVPGKLRVGEWGLAEVEIPNVPVIDRTTGKVVKKTITTLARGQMTSEGFHLASEFAPLASLRLDPIHAGGNSELLAKMFSSGLLRSYAQQRAEIQRENVQEMMTRAARSILDNADVRRRMEERLGGEIIPGTVHLQTIRPRVVADRFMPIDRKTQEILEKKARGLPVSPEELRSMTIYYRLHKTEHGYTVALNPFVASYWINDFDGDIPMLFRLAVKVRQANGETRTAILDGSHLKFPHTQPGGVAKELKPGEIVDTVRGRVRYSPIDSPNFIRKLQDIENIMRPAHRQTLLSFMDDAESMSVQMSKLRDRLMGQLADGRSESTAEKIREQAMKQSFDREYAGVIQNTIWTLDVYKAIESLSSLDEETLNRLTNNPYELSRWMQRHRELFQTGKGQELIEKILKARKTGGLDLSQHPELRHLLGLTPHDKQTTLGPKHIGELGPTDLVNTMSQLLHSGGRMNRETLETLQNQIRQEITGTLLPRFYKRDFPVKPIHETKPLEPLASDLALGRQYEGNWFNYLKEKGVIRTVDIAYDESILAAMGIDANNPLRQKLKSTLVFFRGPNGEFVPIRGGMDPHNQRLETAVFNPIIKMVDGRIQVESFEDYAPREFQRLVQGKIFVPTATVNEAGQEIKRLPGDAAGFLSVEQVLKNPANAVKAAEHLGFEGTTEEKIRKVRTLVMMSPDSKEYKQALLNADVRKFGAGKAGREALLEMSARQKTMHVPFGMGDILVKRADGTVDINPQISNDAAFKDRLKMIQSMINLDMQKYTNDPAAQAEIFLEFQQAAAEAGISLVGMEKKPGEMNRFISTLIGHKDSAQSVLDTVITESTKATASEARQMKNFKQAVSSGRSLKRGNIAIVMAQDNYSIQGWTGDATLTLLSEDTLQEAKKVITSSNLPGKISDTYSRETPFRVRMPDGSYKWASAAPQAKDIGPVKVIGSYAKNENIAIRGHNFKVLEGGSEKHIDMVVNYEEPAGKNFNRMLVQLYEEAGQPLTEEQMVEIFSSKERQLEALDYAVRNFSKTMVQYDERGEEVGRVKVLTLTDDLYVNTSPSEVSDSRAEKLHGFLGQHTVNPIYADLLENISPSLANAMGVTKEEAMSLLGQALGQAREEGMVQPGLEVHQALSKSMEALTKVIGLPLADIKERVENQSKQGFIEFLESLPTSFANEASVGDGVASAIRNVYRNLGRLS